MLRLIFMIPIIQLIIFGYVANTEVKKIYLDVYDFDQSEVSREYIDAFKPGGYFIPKSVHGSLLDEETRFKEGDAEMALIIPENFSTDLANDGRTTVGLVADGANSNTAAIGMGYAQQISIQYARDITRVEPPLAIRYDVLYNPEAESVYFMVPGIVAALLTMVTVMLTSMAIVRERENGTLEQIMVSPISTSALLIGKLVPFAILGIFEMIIALTVGILWFGVPFAGSPLLLFALAELYLLTTLGMGLFFSTVTSTQQQAMFFAWFFSVFALLTSGLFTPVSNMPMWMQYVTYINPMRFFMEIARGIMMRGAGLKELMSQIVVLIIFGTVVFGFSAMRFRKRTA
jgi:ABC-2 type transport system permease protein